jgi:uncharacterized membrane protein SpoIIM required for sporulation
VDIDRFIVTHQGSWERLDGLAKTARRSVRRLSADELDELIALYQRVSGHLSVVQTEFGDAATAAQLTGILARARGVIYREHGSPVAAMGGFFTSTFPAAIYLMRRSIAIAAIVLLLPAFAMGIWLNNNAAARNAAVDPQLAQLVSHGGQFENYYSEHDASVFQTLVTTNNIRVGLMAFAGGALLGVPPLLLLATNGQHIGEMGAVMHAEGMGAKFWGLILPHGLLELTCIVIAGAAGLAIGWAIIAPGDRRRGEAMVEQGNRSLVAMLGAAVGFVIAAIIESRVTPSGLPTAARVGLGVTVWVAFMLYTFGLGRNAALSGDTGTFGQQRHADRLDSQQAAALQVEVQVAELRG